MTIKIGINGMGRIGRMVVRSIIENNYKDIYKYFGLTAENISKKIKNLLKN